MRVTNRSLYCLSVYGKRIKTLQVSECPFVSDRGLISVIKRCPTLESLQATRLRVNNGFAVSGSTAGCILENSKQLKYLSIAGCYIETAHIEQLARMDGIEILELGLSQTITDPDINGLIHFVERISLKRIQGFITLNDSILIFKLPNMEIRIMSHDQNMLHLVPLEVQKPWDGYSPKFIEGAV